MFGCQRIVGTREKVNKIDTVNNNDTHYETTANKTEQNASVMIKYFCLFRGLVFHCGITVWMWIHPVTCIICVYICEARNSKEPKKCYFRFIAVDSITHRILNIRFRFVCTYTAQLQYNDPKTDAMLFHMFS